MTRFALAALLATALAGPADALSCLRPSVAQTFTEASAAEAQYVLAVGRVSLMPGETIPSTGDDPNDRRGYAVEARFDGVLASPTGFDDDAAFPLTVEVECAGAWCGAVPLAERVLAFVERRGDRNVLVEGPCPFWALRATPEVVAQAEACLRGEACAAE